MSPLHTPLPYDIDGVTYDGVLVTEPGTAGPTKTVLVFHGMEGRSDAQLEIAGQLCGLGYQAVAVDLFGPEVTPGEMTAGRDVVNRFLADREALQQRITRVLAAITAKPEIDGTPLAAIGFCFGGLCVLDVARAGHRLKGVASFHGILTPPPNPPATDVSAKIAIYHGWDDPFAPPADVAALASELSGRGIDWQLHAYGDTMHAFMARFANDPENGIQYDARAAGRAWTSLVDFLSEVFEAA